MSKRWAALKRRIEHMGDPFDPAGTMDKRKAWMAEIVEDIEKRVPEPEGLRVALELALARKHALMEETYDDDVEQIMDASLILQDAITEAITALASQAPAQVHLSQEFLDDMRDIEYKISRKAPTKRRKDDYIPTKRGRFCNHADAMGNGCSDSWWTGGNYGGSICRNPAHHESPTQEKNDEF